MTDAEDRSPELEIKSDEDWKDRVKAEDARLDAERDEESDAPPPTDAPSSTVDAAQSPAADEAEASTVEEPGGSAIEEAGESQPPIDAAQLPKPEFSTLVGLFSTQAMVSLGLMGHPEDGQTDVQLPLARHFIDMLGVLDEKTKGNLTDAEARMLEQSLHDLRMVYLERSRAE